MHVRLAAVVNLGGQALLAGLFMLRLAGAVQPAPQRNAANATRRVLNALRLKRVCWAGLFEDVALLFVWTASVQQVLLVFDPRYREFPVASFAVPLVVTLARAFAGDFRRGTGGREELVLGLVLVGGAVASAVQEGWLNGQSLLWNGCAVVLTVGVWWSLWPGPEGRDGLRSSPSYGVSVGS